MQRAPLIVVLVGLGGCRLGFDPVDEGEQDPVTTGSEPGGTRSTTSSSSTLVIAEPGSDFITTCAPGTACEVDCTAASTCIVNCNGAASCDVACTESQCVVEQCSQATCDVDCGAGQRLEITPSVFCN